MDRSAIGLFYGSSTCYTEMSAEKIRDKIGHTTVDLFNIADEPIANTQFYDYLIFGIPTWDYGELQADWEEIWAELSDLDLNGRAVAIYGQGDQIGYPEWFQDAVGYLHDRLIEQGARPVGYWPVDGYVFEASKALTEDKQHFVGLPLDDENEFHLSEDRIAKWCQQILTEFGINETHPKS